jgi:DnaJ-class molecular chaperone
MKSQGRVNAPNDLSQRSTEPVRLETRFVMEATMSRRTECPDCLGSGLAPNRKDFCKRCGGIGQVPRPGVPVAAARGR